MFAISTASKNPDRAMMFLNLLNTDPYLMTLLNYGVEGVHYNLNADGLVEFTDKRADYQPWRNGMGNITLLPPQAGEGVGFWDNFKAYYGSAKEIPILGFAFNGKNVETEMGALSNVGAEYMLALDTGTVDPAEKLPEFLQKLDDNGMQKVVDEANTQLQAFLAAKGQ
jgi:putative aldouronate transport system substrate-binding protein